MQRVLFAAMLGGACLPVFNAGQAQNTPVILVCSGVASADGDPNHQTEEDDVQLVVGPTKIEMPTSRAGSGEFSISEYRESEVKFSGSWSPVSGQKPLFASGYIDRISGDVKILTLSTTPGLALGPYFFGRCQTSSRVF